MTDAKTLQAQPLRESWPAPVPISDFVHKTERVTDPEILKGLVQTWRIPTLNIQGYNFLSGVVEDYAGEETKANKRDVVACFHGYEGSLPEIFVIPQYADPVVMIPKNSSCSKWPDIKERIRAEGFPVEDKIGKSVLYEPEKAVAFLKRRVNGTPFYIADHGGYFAPAAKAICEAFSHDQFLGFTEFTANGEDRYKRYEEGVDRPILSIARSEIKKIADRSAGLRIAETVGHKFHELSGMSLKGSPGLKVGVIGFGPIGKYVARGFKDMHCENLMVCEIDGFRGANAAQQGFIPAKLDQIVAECDIIQSANGKAALRKPKYWAMMKDNAVIASSTSADDELDLEGLIRDGVLVYEGTNNDVATYKVSETGKRVHLIANGEAANTLLRSGIGDPTLFLPQAAQIVANLMVSNRDPKLKPGFQKLHKRIEDQVSERWTQYFHAHGSPVSQAQIDYDSIMYPEVG